MNTTYTVETIARQRMDETARRARSAHERHQITSTRTRTGWHFPKFSFPRHAVTPRSA